MKSVSEIFKLTRYCVRDRICRCLCSEVCELTAQTTAACVNLSNQYRFQFYFIQTATVPTWISTSSVSVERCLGRTRSSREIQPSRGCWVRRRRTGTETETLCRSYWHCSCVRRRLTAASCCRSGVHGWPPVPHADTRSTWTKRCSSTDRISTTSPDRLTTAAAWQGCDGGVSSQRPPSVLSSARWCPATTPACFGLIR